MKKHNPRAWPLMILLLLLSQTLRSQPARDFTFYNDTTYQLYLAEDWQALTSLAREALRGGYDYYYLRMRLGIAYREEGQPLRAIPQFYRALTFNRGDEAARAFLAAALRAAGRFDEARLHEPHPFFQVIGGGAEAGYQFSDDRTPVGDRYFGNLFVRHRLGRSLFFTHQYQRLAQRFTDRELIVLPPMGNRPPRQLIRTFEREVVQHEYFLASAFQMERGWRLEGGFRYLTFQDSAGGYGEQLYSLRLRKDLPFLRLQVGGGTSTFARGRQYQASGGLTLFPLGSPGLYLGHTSLLRWENNDRPDAWQSQHLGVRLFPGSWLEGFYEWGRIDHFFAHNGGFAYNIPDDLRQRWGLSWQLWLQGRHLLYLVFIDEKKEEVADRTPYHHRTLMLGLSLNFN